MSDPAIHYPFQKRSKLNAGDTAAVPMSLSNQFPNGNITQISQLQLNRHEEIRKSYFVLIQTRSEHEEYIGYVQSIWIAGGHFFIHVHKMKKQDVHPFYGMRGFIKTQETRAVHFEDIKSTLNLQHNCHTGKCSVTNTRSTKIERLSTTIKTLEVQHRDDLLFILNSALLHAQENH
ncbi:hypothetical protein H4Q26_007689 [Puccinia striiformis f. sp. tritici PST-130]|nr:hypothetical protein H4Q26_007689 [Puccinia striiformis f. sp. tritici PST-130]